MYLSIVKWLVTGLGWVLSYQTMKPQTSIHYVQWNMLATIILLVAKYIFRRRNTLMPLDHECPWTNLSMWSAGVTLNTPLDASQNAVRVPPFMHADIDIGIITRQHMHHKTWVLVKCTFSPFDINAEGEGFCSSPILRLALEMYGTRYPSHVPVGFLKPRFHHQEWQPLETMDVPKLDEQWFALPDHIQRSYVKDLRRAEEKGLWLEWYPKHGVRWSYIPRCFHLHLAVSYSGQIV